MTAILGHETDQEQQSSESAITPGLATIACRSDAVGDREVKPELLPAQRVLSALAQCHADTYRHFAETLGIELAAINVKLQAAMDLRGVYRRADSLRAGFAGIDATVEISGPADVSEVEKLRVTVEKHSPLVGLIAEPVPVRIELVLKQRPRGKQSSGLAA